MIADIRLMADHAAAQRLYKFHRFRQILRRRIWIIHCRDIGAEIDSDDVRPILRKPNRVCSSLPSCRTRDECDFPFEIAHQTLPFIIAVAVRL